MPVITQHIYPKYIYIFVLFYLTSFTAMCSYPISYVFVCILECLCRLRYIEIELYLDTYKHVNRLIWGHITTICYQNSLTIAAYAIQ